MKIKVQIERPLFKRSQVANGARIYNFTPPARPFIDTLTECAGPQNLECLRNQQVVDAAPRAMAPASPVEPAPVQKPTPQPIAVESAKTQATPSTLHKAFAWLRKNYNQRSVKKLRVAETVSLGEKRFVAIVQVEDRKYLIGGGASGVSLLTALDEARVNMTETALNAEVSQSLPRLRGVY